MNSSYLFKFLVGLDMFVSVLIFRDPDVTISSECGIAIQRDGNRLLRWLGWLLNHISVKHCQRAMLNDIARAKQAIERITDMTVKEIKIQ